MKKNADRNTKFENTSLADLIAWHGTKAQERFFKQLGWPETITPFFLVALQTIWDVSAVDALLEVIKRGSKRPAKQNMPMLRGLKAFRVAVMNRFSRARIVAGKK